jgi:hypothetical protein
MPTIQVDYVKAKQTAVTQYNTTISANTDTIIATCGAGQQWFLYGWFISNNVDTNIQFKTGSTLLKTLYLKANQSDASHQIAPFLAGSVGENLVIKSTTPLEVVLFYKVV